MLNKITNAILNIQGVTKIPVTMTLHKNYMAIVLFYNYLTLKIKINIFFS